MSPPSPFYSRDGLNVQTYDLRTALDIARATVRGDADWYARRAREWGGPVLEGACGTGRVAWTLAEAGLEVTGFDLSPHMLRQAEARRARMPGEVARRATFVPGDMADFDLGRTFPLAIVPFRAFQALLTPEAQRAALARFRAHLVPGGRLVLDLFDPRLDYLIPGTPSPVPDRESVRHPERGTLVTVDIGARAVDPLRQVFGEPWTFREHAADGEVLLEETEVLELRWSYRYEMRHLFEIAGFEVEAEYSDFEESPPAYGKEQVWVLRSPQLRQGTLLDP